MDDERRRRIMERITVAALVLLVTVVVVDRVVSPGESPAPPPGDVAGVSGSDERPAAAGPDTVRSDTSRLDTAEAAVGTAATAQSAAADTATPQTAEQGAASEATPEVLDLELERDSLTVPAGSEVSLRAMVAKEGRPRAGVPLVLDGSEALPGVGRRVEAVTDSTGVAVFRFRAGDDPATVRMRVLARGYWLQGDNRLTMRVVP